MKATPVRYPQKTWEGGSHLGTRGCGQIHVEEVGSAPHERADAEADLGEPCEAGGESWMEFGAPGKDE